MGFDPLMTVLIAIILGVLWEVSKTSAEVRRLKRRMEAASIKSETAKALADHGLKQSIDTAVRIGAIEKSTHTIYPVEAKGDLMGELLEKQLQKATGLPDEDFDSDLVKHGFDEDPTMDDLV